MSHNRPSTSSSIHFRGLPSSPLPPPKPPRITAIVYCEGNFGGIDGKTANGLVRHSEKYEILSIIDSEQAGQDAGEILDDEPNGIPILQGPRRGPG